MSKARRAGLIHSAILACLGITVGASAQDQRAAPTVPTVTNAARASADDTVRVEQSGSPNPQGDAEPAGGHAEPAGLRARHLAGGPMRALRRGRVHGRLRGPTPGALLDRQADPVRPAGDRLDGHGPAAPAAPARAGGQTEAAAALEAALLR